MRAACFGEFGINLTTSSGSARSSSRPPAGHLNQDNVACFYVIRERQTQLGNRLRLKWTMDSVDIDVLSMALEWYADATKVVVATVTRT